MTSVERVIEYTKLPQEAPKKYDDASRQPPTKEWPAEGRIRCKDVSFDYGDGVKVLKNLNCDIAAKEKIGIVGRTGAGKSSLINMLFRMNELEGKMVGFLYIVLDLPSLFSFVIKPLNERF